MAGISDIPIATLRQMLDKQNDASIKRYYEYDSDGDVTSIYYAQAQTGNGGVCLQKRFEYQTVSGVKNLVKRDYQALTWNSAWDI